MRTAPILLLIIAVGLLAGPSLSSGSAARAVVVGVNHPGDAKAPNLAGCLNDARELQKTLERKGFQVTTLLDSQASRDSVLKALQQAGSAERLVFYFAGYGSGPDAPRLLTSDVREAQGSLQGGLTLTDLDRSLRDLPCKDKTVILDCSFTPTYSPSSKLRSRYYHPQAASREITIRVEDRDLPGITPESIHYLTASRYNEDALEGACQGEQHGIFTDSLVRQANKLTPQDSWKGLQVRVSSTVSEQSDDRQHPTIPPAWNGWGGPQQSAKEEDEFLARVGAEPAPRGAAQTTSVWSLFNVDSRDPAMVHLALEPDRSPVKVGEYLSFHARCGRDGYLVMVEHSVENRLELIHPRDGQVESARVRAGEIVRVPAPGEKVYAATPGRERLKAFLMTSQANALALITQLKSDQGIGFNQAPTLLGSRAVEFVTESEYASHQNSAAPTKLGGVGVIEAGQGTPFYTSDISFEVVK